MHKDIAERFFQKYNLPVAILRQAQDDNWQAQDDKSRLPTHDS